MNIGCVLRRLKIGSMSKMKKYWVITRCSDDHTFKAYPADETNLKAVTEIAMLGRDEGCWVAEQKYYHPQKPSVKEE